jgi:hypothetical protein
MHTLIEHEHKKIPLNEWDNGLDRLVDKKFNTSSPVTNVTRHGLLVLC